jgi:hypothetical protein
MEADQVSETSCLLVLRMLDNDQSPVILSVIHLRQNVLDPNFIIFCKINKNKMAVKGI